MQSLVNNNRTRTLLLIDDVKMEANEYEEAFTKKSAYDIKVTMRHSASDVLRSIREADVWDIVVVDMMMPCGSELDSHECAGGKFTGVVLIREIRKVWRTTPIILLSSAHFEDVKLACKTAALRTENCLFLEKHRYLPHELTKLVDTYFREGRLDIPTQPWLKKIFGMLLLQPNIGGIGVDLKGLGDKK